MRLGGLGVLWAVSVVSCIGIGSAGENGGHRGTGGGPGVVGPACAPRLLLEGTQGFVDLFVLDEGILIVAADAVRLVGRDGQVLRTATWPREITAAALDGQTLVIADRAAITVTTPALDAGPTALLVETCAAGVLVGGGARFVCGPANDWNRVFYTYAADRSPPELISRNGQFTYGGIPMRRVPATDDFLTVNDLLPSSFYLLRVDQEGKVGYLDESSLNGDYPVTTAFAFDGTPPSHVIQSTGLLLKMYGDGCAASALDSSCFVKDGVLGTLRGQESFIGLADDGAGQLYGIAATPDTSGFLCRAGCSFQHIDIASRAIVSQQTCAVANLISVDRIAGDSASGSVIVGYSTSDPAGTSRGGFRVASFAY